MTDWNTRLGDTLAPTYRIERELGGGGMSHVFLAQEVALDRKVVIKVLPPEMAAGVNQDRFRREIQLAARLQHPHVVPLLAAGSTGDLLYYVMPYIEGESLRVKLAREGELPVSETVRILREVTDALAYAHEQGVVHRDIKPDNVMISRGHALVTDFGVAKAVSESTGGQSLTSLGVALGTPAYMAPEQASADPHVDHRADLYSLGALAYEMLAGRPPFVGGTAQALLVAQVTQTPDRVSMYRPTVPTALETVVMRCLEKHAADRWQTANELLPHLDALLTPTTGLPPTSATIPVSSGTEAALRQAHPVRVAALFAVASLALLTVAWLLVQRLGLPGWVVPVAGVLLVLGLPVMLLTAARERERIRLRTTGHHVVAPTGLADRLLTWRGAIAGGGLALGGLAVGTGTFMTLRAMGVGPFATLVSAGVLKPRDPLVLADFANRTADSTLGGSITEAFRIDLTRSPVVRLVESNEVAATLRRMQRDPAQPLSEATAREVAQREGAKAVVAGDVSRLGSGFVLAARLVGATDSATLVAERETAADAAGIIPAVERLSKKLRERIGESLRTIRGGQPLEQVTTTSLAALRAYSEGSRAADAGQQGAALAFFGQATALDSNFGMAWRRTGVVLSNISADRARMLAALTRAYQLRDRMPPNEAAHATAFYYYRVEFDRQKTIDAYERLLANWPDDGIALNNLANEYDEQGRESDAERLYRRAIELQPDNALTSGNLIEVLVTQKKFGAADTAMSAWAKRAPGNTNRLRYAARLARERGRFDVALAYGDSAVRPQTPDAQIPGHALRAETLRLLGRFHDAEGETAQTMAVLESNRMFVNYLNQTLGMAMIDAFVLQRPQAAIQRVDAALARHPLDSLPAASRPYGRMIYTYVSAGRVDRAQSLQAEYERVVPSEVRAQDAWFYMGRGSLSLARGDAKAALDDFQHAKDKFGCHFCTAFDAGRAFDKLSASDSAKVQYELVANSSLPAIETRDVTLAASLRRLGELYESKGNREKAVEYYGRFVDLWKSADPELQPLVKDVRRHMGELAGEPKR